MRLATLIGKKVSGDYLNLGIADALTIAELLKERQKIIDSNGIIRQGKSEIKLSEIRLLSTNTAGGEMKARRLFV